LNKSEEDIQLYCAKCGWIGVMNRRQTTICQL
jgi:hypothetical protein